MPVHFYVFCKKKRQLREGLVADVDWSADMYVTTAMYLILVVLLAAFV